MKSFSIVLALAFAVLAIPTFANTSLEGPESKAIVKIKLVDSKAVNVKLFNLQKEKAIITITSLNEDTEYFKETVRNHNGYAKIINLEKLPQGKYLLNVNHQDKLVSQVILIEQNKIRISRGVER